VEDLELIGLIPAAGKGERLGFPFPKELYPVIENNHYKPVSHYILENMTSAGVKHITIVINDTKHQLIKYFGNGSRFNCDISYVVQELRVDDPKTTKTPGLAEAMDTPLCIVMGSEEKGISPSLMELIDNEIRIPLFGQIDSLNVSVAAALIIYEAVKQRIKSPDQK